MYIVQCKIASANALFRRASLRIARACERLATIEPVHGVRVNQSCVFDRFRRANPRPRSLSSAPENNGRRPMRIALALAMSVMFGVAASAQPVTLPLQPAPPPFIDWDKVEIKTTDLGHGTYRL